MSAALAETYADTDAPLFRSANAAVVFALTRDGNPCRPVQSRMCDTTTGRTDLAGVDGAGMAGIIMSRLSWMGRLGVACLVASVAKPSRPCACRAPCCSGHAVNREWRDAIDTIAHAITDSVPLKVSYALRSAIVVRCTVEKATSLISLTTSSCTGTQSRATIEPFITG